MSLEDIIIAASKPHLKTATMEHFSTNLSRKKEKKKSLGEEGGGRVRLCTNHLS